MSKEVLTISNLNYTIENRIILKNINLSLIEGEFISIMGPSGSGKTTLCKVVRNVKPELIWSVSYTTREPRDGEVNGEDYNFISIIDFENLIDKGELAEWENVHGNYYGTSKSSLNKAIEEKKILFQVY